MTAAEIAVIGAALASMPDPLKVFEWGCGNSTLYFSNALKRQGRDFRWEAVESDPGWHAFTGKNARALGLHENVRLHLVDFGGVNPRKVALADALRDEYAGKLEAVGGNARVAIVDGRFRRRCLELARKTQIADSIVLLMDAERPYYLCGEKDSPTGLLVPTGVSPFRAREKRKCMWLGFDTAGKREEFDSKVLGPLDLPALIRETELIHQRAHRRSLLSAMRGFLSGKS